MKVVYRLFNDFSAIECNEYGLSSDLLNSQTREFGEWKKREEFVQQRLLNSLVVSIESTSFIEKMKEKIKFKGGSLHPISKVMQFGKFDTKVLENHQSINRYTVFLQAWRFR